MEQFLEIFKNVGFSILFTYIIIKTMMVIEEAFFRIYLHFFMKKEREDLFFMIDLQNNRQIDKRLFTFVGVIINVIVNIDLVTDIFNPTKFDFTVKSIILNSIVMSSITAMISYYSLWRQYQKHQKSSSFKDELYNHLEKSVTVEQLNELLKFEARCIALNIIQYFSSHNTISEELKVSLKEFLRNEGEGVNMWKEILLNYPNNQFLLRYNSKETNASYSMLMMYVDHYIEFTPEGKKIFQTKTFLSNSIELIEDFFNYRLV